ncbi:lipase ZK262.3-like isoform X2 [Zingiber officinale]|uniref:lipase ZK262.3-like isoform X2 n=1 Tax=Zingiber officinale TaxID=94328 RepID=UPI001C4C73AE|nr:lipase ZK262.3-like isoform X2 [Zingiber officinale]
MGRWLRFAALVIVSLFVVSVGREIKINYEDELPVYNHTLAKIIVEYASAVYITDLTELFTWTCSRCDDFTKEFEVIELIVDIQNCLQAFVGVDPDLNSIVIAFRGTQEHSLRNWIEDLFWKQLDLKYPGMPDAMVHHGFYSAYHNTTLRQGILNAIQRAIDIYGNISIFVTGHSMGGALASFCALDLAVWLQDTEIEGTTRTIEKLCDDSGEDPYCSRSVSGNSIADHLNYYGIALKADSWGSCRIVMGTRAEVQYNVDYNGNIRLSRDPTLSLSKQIYL